MDRRAELGEFLRTRRARLRPEDVGLSAGDRRRVPGLRREELSLLSGVSADYYVRLEQGRLPNISDEVLDAVARTLRLSEPEHEYFRNLVRPTRLRSTTAKPQQVRPELQGLLNAMDGVPAYIIGRRTDLLAWNALGAQLLGDMPRLEPARRNFAWFTFLDPTARNIFADWDTKASSVVANLRLCAGRNPDDARLVSLIGELSVKSQEFVDLWAQHHVKGKTYGSAGWKHPIAGLMTLEYETLVLPGDDEQVLVMWTAPAGSTSAEALDLLASWAAAPPANRPAARSDQNLPLD